MICWAASLSRSPIFYIKMKEVSLVKCLMKYQWVKLPRNHLPEGKGVMGAWAKLASRAALRKGQASYCGYINAVRPGMWSGGVVGLKSNLAPEAAHRALRRYLSSQSLAMSDVR